MMRDTICKGRNRMKRENCKGKIIHRVCTTVSGLCDIREADY